MSKSIIAITHNGKSEYVSSYNFDMGTSSTVNAREGAKAFERDEALLLLGFMVTLYSRPNEPYHVGFNFFTHLLVGGEEGERHVVITFELRDEETDKVTYRAELEMQEHPKYRPSKSIKYGVVE